MKCLVWKMAGSSDNLTILTWAEFQAYLSIMRRKLFRILGFISFLLLAGNAHSASEMAATPLDTEIKPVAAWLVLEKAPTPEPHMHMMLVKPLRIQHTRDAAEETAIDAWLVSKRQGASIAVVLLSLFPIVTNGKDLAILLLIVALFGYLMVRADRLRLAGLSDRLRL